MRWRRLGRIFAPGGQHPWLTSHASTPFALPLGGSLFRIFFTPRDASGQSHVASLVVDMNRPTEVLELQSVPHQSPGDGGAHDATGAMVGWIVAQDRSLVHYYVGWRTDVAAPYHVSIGRAHWREADQRFEPDPAPVLDVGPRVEHFASTPCVLSNPCGGWQMWFLNGTGWADIDGRPSPTYAIGQASSTDGTSWQVAATPAVAPVRSGQNGHDEIAIARPSVLSDASGWLMWYAVRGRHSPYRIGLARSEDGHVWERDDGAFRFAGNAGDWEQEMQAYPHVFEHDGERFMLYCGDGFGRAGFGIAQALPDAQTI